MPKIEEPREEEREQKESFQVAFIKRIQNPDRKSLAANSIVSSTLAIPMAEEDTIGIECMAIISHQIDKAKMYKETLPTKKGFAKTTIQEGVITGANLTNFGRGYKKVPDVIITDYKGTGAKIKAVIGVIYANKSIFGNTGKQWIVKRLIIENGGKDYSPDTKIEIKGGEGVGATAALDISGIVSGISIEDKGEKYTFPPSITIEDGGGAGASAVAKINRLGQLESMAVLTCGRGYITAPSVVINVETQETYNERLEAFNKSLHILSDELVYNIRMNSLSITGVNVDNVKEIAQGILQNIGTQTGASEQQ